MTTQLQLINIIIIIIIIIWRIKRQQWCLSSLLSLVFYNCLLVKTINQSVLKFHFIATYCPSHLLRNEAGSTPWPDNICDTSDQHRLLWRMQHFASHFPANNSHVCTIVNHARGLEKRRKIISAISLHAKNFGVTNKPRQIKRFNAKRDTWTNSADL